MADAGFNEVCCANVMAALDAKLSAAGKWMSPFVRASAELRVKVMIGVIQQGRSADAAAIDALMSKTVAHIGGAENRVVGLGAFDGADVRVATFILPGPLDPAQIKSAALLDILENG